MYPEKLTGRQIFEKINRLDKELKELDSACSMVEDECGKGTLPHSLLMNAYNAKKTELIKANNENYGRVE
jgi:hypothetical protein